MDIDLLTGPPGCGKSSTMRKEAIQDPGRYLFAMPTIALIKEQAAAFRLESPGLDLTEAHSKAVGKGSVQKRINDAVKRIDANGIQHAVVIITHESLMDCDLSEFTGWHARIDEAPNTVQSGKVNASASIELLANAFALTPVGSTGWAEVSLKIDKPSWRNLAADHLFKPLAEFIKQASRQNGVFVDRQKWEKSFGWCSVWLPTALSHFASVRIAGASYDTSLGALIAKKHLVGEVNLTVTPKAMPRTGFPTIRVHYFTRSHEGTSKFWSEHVGRGFIVKVCDFLAAREPNLGFWAGNEPVEILMDHRVNGGPVPPKLMGLNEYRGLTSCAFIYSSKPTPSDAPVQTLFDLTDAEIRRAREDEDVIQFVMRGAIREADFGGGYDIYLYSKRQAETLVTQLESGGIGQAVTLVPEFDAGIMDVDPDPEKAIRKAATADKKKERRANKAKSAKKSRAKKAVSEGRAVGKPGRPAKGNSPA